MKRHLLAIACIGTVLITSAAWTQDPSRRLENPDQDLINDLSQDPGDTPSRVRDDALREQLLQLVEEKAQLMDREALEEALSEVQNDISELQALRKLEEARQILSSIVEEHAGTDGAARAQRMLDTDDKPVPESSGDRFFNPI